VYRPTSSLSMDLVKRSLRSPLARRLILRYSRLMNVAIALAEDGSSRKPPLKVEDIAFTLGSDGAERIQF
jgi:hypothetical protein